MTAYRQQALKIAELLQQNGPTKAAHVAHALQAPKARDILYRDAYGWFEQSVGRRLCTVTARACRRFRLGSNGRRRRRASR